jgi:hypothetical protein
MKLEQQAVYFFLLRAQAVTKNERKLTSLECIRM